MQQLIRSEIQQLIAPSTCTCISKSYIISIIYCIIFTLFYIQQILQQLHIRGGNILPLQYPALTTTASRLKDFFLVVALNENGAASGELFWDDGESVEFERQYYNAIIITVQAIIHISFIQIHIHGFFSC